MRIVTILALLAFIAAMLFYVNVFAEEVALYGIAGIVRSSTYVGMFTGSITYALLFGGPPERTIAAILLGAFVGDPLLHWLIPDDDSPINTVHFILDATECFAFLIVALNANRLWTLWLSAIQTITLMSHGAKLFDISIHPIIYAIMHVGWAYAVLLVLVLGTRNRRQRMKMFAEDKSWSSFSPLSKRTLER